MFIAVAAGDLHMGLKDLGQCRSGDSIHSFGQVLNLADTLANKYDIDVPVILAGDIWDQTSVHPEALKWAINIRNNYKAEIFYVNGNHDHITPSWTSFFDRAYRLDETPTKICPGLSVVGYSWTLPKDFQTAIAENTSKNNFNLLVCHQFITEREDSIIPAAIPVSAFDGIDCPVVAGDIHKPLIVGDKVIYTNCTNRRTLVEPLGSCLIISDTELKDLPAPLSYETNDKGKSVLEPEFVYQTILDGKAVKMYFYRRLLENRRLNYLGLDKPFGVDDVHGVVDWINSITVPTEPGPYVVLTADSFDPKAVRELNALVMNSDVYMIYRRKDGVAIENEDSDTSIALSGAKDYAKEAIRDYPVSQAAKDLAMVMIDNDDQFFEELNRRFEL